LPKESELADIRRTKESLGPRPSGLFLDFSRLEPLVSPSPSQQQDVYRSLATAISDIPPAQLKIKDLILRAIVEHLRQGCTPAELSECITRAYAREIDSASIRPTLARLKDDGILVRDVAGKWTLDPGAAAFIASEFSKVTEPTDEFWNSPLIKAAQALAWRDDEQTERAVAERLEESRLHRVATSDADAKEIGPQGVRPVARNGG